MATMTTLKVFMVGALVCAVAPLALADDSADGWDYAAVSEILKEAQEESSPFFEGTVLNPAQVNAKPADEPVPEEQKPEPKTDPAEAMSEAVAETIAAAFSDFGPLVEEAATATTSAGAAQAQAQAAEPCDEAQMEANQNQQPRRAQPTEVAVEAAVEDDYCVQAVRECAERTCAGQRVAENECQQTAAGFTTSCACADSAGAFSSSSFTTGGAAAEQRQQAAEEDPFMNMFARRFGPFQGQQRPTPSPLELLLGGARPQRPMPMMAGGMDGPRLARGGPMGLGGPLGFFGGPFLMGGNDPRAAGAFLRRRPAVPVIEIDIALGDDEDGPEGAALGGGSVDFAPLLEALMPLTPSFLQRARPVTIELVEMPRQPRQEEEALPPRELMLRQQQKAEAAPRRTSPQNRMEEWEVMEGGGGGGGDGAPPPAGPCMMLLMGLVLMTAATCCCCARGRAAADADDDEFVEVVDVDAYTPLMSQEEAAAEKPLEPLAHEEALKA